MLLYNDFMAKKKPKIERDMMDDIKHNVNNPLLVLLGQASMLRRNLKDEKSIERLDKIEENLQRITDYVESLKDHLD